MQFEGFDWDKGNVLKCERHGLCREEIESFFSGQVWTAPDPKHSGTEERYLAFGRTAGGRAIFVVFTFRKRAHKLLIRPISARYMHIKEIEKYEKAFAKIEK